MSSTVLRLVALFVLLGTSASGEAQSSECKSIAAGGDVNPVTNEYFDWLVCTPESICASSCFERRGSDALGDFTVCKCGSGPALGTVCCQIVFRGDVPSGKGNCNACGENGFCSVDYQEGGGLFGSSWTAEPYCQDVESNPQGL
jgi:hypothetical protein